MTGYTPMGVGGLVRFRNCLLLTFLQNNRSSVCRNSRCSVDKLLQQISACHCSLWHRLVPVGPPPPPPGIGRGRPTSVSFPAALQRISLANSPKGVPLHSGLS